MSNNVTQWPDNVVVFGASGFVGRNLLRRLVGKVRRLVAVSQTGFTASGVDACRMDDLSRLRLAGETAIVHLAAHRYDASNFRRAQTEILRNNLAITTTVYAFALEHEIREVRLASSIAVYDGTCSVLDDATPLNLQLDPARSELMYGWSKRMSEILARLYCETDAVNTIAFRLSNPYGPFDSLNENKAHVIPAFILRAMASPEGAFTVRGSPQVSRDFIHVDDVCAVLERSLHLRGMNSVYNLASGTNTQIGDLAAAILALLDQRRDVVCQGEGTSAVTHRRCIVERLFRDFQIDACIPLVDGLRDTIAWYRNAKLPS